MTRQPDVPDLPDLAGGLPFEHDLLATAFHLLLADPRPVGRGRLAEALGRDPALVQDGLARLDRQGRIRLDQAGAVTGSHGLSVTPTPHELVIERQGQEQRYWTWCAWDAVGILAALEASGRIRSTSPSSGAPIELEVDRGQPRPADPELVVFFADTDGCASGSVIDDWCPLVNFFEDAATAQAWAAAHGVGGSVVALADATSQGKAAWTRWIADHDHRDQACC